MFSFFLKFKSFIPKSTFSFTTIPILQLNLNLHTQSSFQIQENFLKTHAQISHQEFLTYVGFFSSAAIHSSSIWDTIYGKLKHILDQFSFAEMALLCSFIGESRKYDEKFWSIMEIKFLENLYADEDTFYLLSLFLNGFVNRGIKVSNEFSTRLLEYVDSSCDQIKGNDLASLAHMIAKLRSSMNENPQYKPVLSKLLTNCVKEIKFLDFKGLGHLANALNFSKNMNEILEKEIVRNLFLVENDANFEGIQLVYQAFKDSEVLKGKVGETIMSFVMQNVQTTKGKTFVDSCFIIMKNEINYESILQALGQRIKNEIDLFDGKDSIKIGVCYSKLNLKEDAVLQKLRENVFKILEEVTAEELLWVYEGFAEVIANDQEFWKKTDEVFQRLMTQITSKDIVIINNYKKTFRL